MWYNNYVYLMGTGRRAGRKPAKASVMPRPDAGRGPDRGLKSTVFCCPAHISAGAE